MTRRSLVMWLATTLLAGGLLPSPPPGAAGTAEDQLGNWLIWNGTLRFADRWAVFTESQLRLYEPVSEPQEFFVRLAPQYDIRPNLLGSVGYTYVESWPYGNGPKGTENRIYEQLQAKHQASRAVFDHRFRLEQRWLDDPGGSDYRNRFRYRLQVTTPLNREKLEAKTHFLNFYDELMLNLGGELDTFDQNRLYGAYGWQFTQQSNLQLGLLWQAKKSADFFRLQIFYTHNFDFRG